MVKSRTAVAPCSTANLGPGYDVFGLALDALEDKVKITALPTPISRRPGSIMLSVQNNSRGIPTTVESNSAGLVIKKMARDFDVRDTLNVEIEKGIPAGYGMGSSAASAAAAALAFQSLYDLKTDADALVEYAAEGEIASAGTRHYDNVSASLIGGFVISSTSGPGKRHFIRIDPPVDLVLVAAVPLSIKVPKRKTEVARRVLPKEVPLGKVVHNVSCASTIVAGFALKNVELIASGIDDVIVEPPRRSLIPGYDAIKRNALAAGALAVTISGAGPSMIAFMKTAKNSKKVSDAMQGAFSEAHVTSKTFVCRPSNGARIL